MNRSDFMIRQLHYYGDLEFQGCICIGDSSNAMHLERTKRVVKELQGKLNIIHQEYPDLNEPQCIQQLLNFVRTPYVTWVGDDDFLVPSGLEKCVQFLGDHPEYSAAHGVAVRIKTKDSKPYGRIIECSGKTQPMEKAKRAAKRFISYMNYPTDAHFSVRRVQTLLLAYKNAHLLDKRFAAELPSWLTVVIGKIKELDCVSVVRQINDNKYYTLEQSDTYAWITNPKWASHFKIVHDTLAEELIRQDSISLDEAKEVLKLGLSTYIHTRFVKEVNEHYTVHSIPTPVSKILHVGMVSNLKIFIKRIPYVGLPIKKLYSLIFQSSEKQYDMSLKSLLKPSSPYHKDFMPIYRAITEENE